MSRRRQRRIPERVLAEQGRAQRTAGAGFMYAVSPLDKQASAVAQAIGSLGANGVEEHQIDTFTLSSAGAQDLDLTYLPQPGSWNVSLAGVALTNEVGFSVDAQTLSLLSAASPQAGEVVQIQYDYLTGIPAIAAAPFADLIAELGPLWWGRLSDVSNGGTLADSSGHAHHGAWNSVTTHDMTSGLIVNDNDLALLMTGAGGEGGHVTSASWMNLTTDMTWICFLKSSDASCRLWAREQTSGGGQDWSIQYGAGQVFFAAGGSLVVSSIRTDLDDASRHMVAIRKTSSTVDIWLDDAQDAIAPHATPLGTTAMDLLIGYGGGLTTSHLFSGVLDECIWFDKVLSDAQLAQIWDAAT